jgi:glycosyltransferase involved in cell wall biosynthesis
MRIGIDARELCGHPTGVGRYLGGLIQEWASDESAHGHEFILYAPEDLPLPSSPAFRTRIVSGPAGTWWEQVRLRSAMTADRLDVFFAPAYSCPLRHEIPVVLALHDLSFVAHPEWFTTREGLRRRWLARQSADCARALITISQFSRRELLEHLRIPDDRIHVIPPGITTPVRSEKPAPGAGAPPRVLFVGSIFNRRHLPDLVRAFAPIAHAHPTAALDIVGDNRTFPYQDLASEITLQQLDRQVRWRRYVSDAELAELFGAARAFAFLSEYEGLGLTPLEALSVGVPPVVLDTPVARESCQDAAVYVQKDDVRATTAALHAMLFDEEHRARILGARFTALAQYSWPRAARDTLALLERCGR